MDVATVISSNSLHGDSEAARGDEKGTDLTEKLRQLRLKAQPHSSSVFLHLTKKKHLMF